MHPVSHSAIFSNILFKDNQKPSSTFSNNITSFCELPTLQNSIPPKTKLNNNKNLTPKIKCSTQKNKCQENSHVCFFGGKVRKKGVGGRVLGLSLMITILCPSFWILLHLFVSQSLNYRHLCLWNLVDHLCSATDEN